MPLVISTDERVGVVHAGTVDGEPVDHPDVVSLRTDHFQHHHFVVRVVSN
jgi:hypothetical protein